MTDHSQASPDKDIAHAVALAVRLIRIEWFGTVPVMSDAHNFALLLFSVFQAAAVGKLLTKKDAKNLIGAQHLDTAAKYISRAHESGLITIHRFSADRRIEHLVPTAKLQEVVKSEAQKLMTIMRLSVDDLSPVELRGDITTSEFDEDHRDGSSPNRTMAPQIDWTHINRERAKKEILKYTEAIRLLPDSAPAYEQRANAYSDIRMHENAIADLTEAIRLDPTSPRYYFNRSLTWHTLGSFQEALNDCKRALALKPDPTLEIMLFRRCARALSKLGNENAALAEIERGLRLHPTSDDLKRDHYQFSHHAEVERTTRKSPKRKQRKPPREGTKNR